MGVVYLMSSTRRVVSSIERNKREERRNINESGSTTRRYLPLSNNEGAIFVYFFVQKKFVDIFTSSLCWMDGCSELEENEMTNRKKKKN